jgi:uncharacterized membrane protein (DUF373 family)
MKRSSVETFTEHFERVVIWSLIVLLTIVIALALIDLGWIIAEDIITPPLVLLAIDELLEIFGFLLLILIGLELLETVKAYLHTSKIRVETVIEVALIAIARKIVILETEDGLFFVGIAAVILALAVAVYLARVSRRTDASAHAPPA